MAASGPLYMGFDLSTQQLKGVVVDSQLKHQHEAKVDFDADFGEKYGIEKGVLTNPSEGEIYAPVGMWLEAVDLVLSRLREDGLDFSRVKGVSGAGMQHGTVFWSQQAESLLSSLDAKKSLVEQLEPSAHKDERKGAFSHPDSPNWQDHSTQKQCDKFDAELGSPETLAEATGSGAHHRFSGPQIMRFKSKYPDHYKETSRISLVSSFLASVFLGKFAPIDISDVTGMNLWHIKEGKWNEKLLALAAGSTEGAAELKQKLGHVPEDGGASFGHISKYFVQRYGFAQDCNIVPMTGDNPATILALPLQASDAMVSLGTSTTFLMSTPQYKPDPAYHFMNHPTTAGLYMFMLCYKNGGLAREHIRDAINGNKTDRSWDKFNEVALSTPPMDQRSSSDPMRMGLYFPRPEIVPNVRAGQWRYEYDASSNKLNQTSAEQSVDADARGIVESQMLSLRLRSAALVSGHEINGKKLPPQPRRVYLVGGGSANPAIARIIGDVLGGAEGIYKLDIGGNACALGGAYKAVWGCERRGKQTFEQLVEERWDEDAFVKRVADGYREGVFEKYGEALRGFEAMEKEVVKATSEGVHAQDNEGGFMAPQN
ncbi:putative D-Xylulose kinase [Aureobasidium namibiae CBS 147.97]|uniref:Xylulose kinase n=1 Tax=Aureobasidium namibiae CBS 147.97 TaxID=1043004 RepID=A0A074WYM3_9PEZI